MAFCKYCQADVTLSPSLSNKCPTCGRDLLSIDDSIGTSFEEEFGDDMTVAFIPSVEGGAPAGEEYVGANSDSGAPEMELDFTQVFGGKFIPDDDLGEFEGIEEIALDEASTPEVTQALGSAPGGSRPPSVKDETVPRPADSTSPDATHVIGAQPEDSGQSEWPSGVTMPVGLSGSDRADSGSPDTHREAETIMHDSGTLAMGSGRRSTHAPTPQSRELTGLSSGRTIPRGPLGEGGASRSLKAGDVQFVGPEQVRLRAFGLGEGLEKEEEIDFLLRGAAGKGGMGIVYRSLQRSLDRDVAVKQMKPDLADSESDRNKFLTEAVITGQLEHPNIVPVHELGLAADGLPFYAMKFVIGDDWEDRLKKLTEQENLSILIQVANAIAFAHSRNVIHRDLKPGNVRLGSFGEVLVMDWGLAARLDREGEIPPAGTPLYMAPETALEYLDHVNQQAVGGAKERSTRRIKAGTYSDIYLLGALLFKIVTGKAPHSGKTPFECLRNAAKNRIVKVERSSELLDIAYKAMATDPADRYRAVPEFVDAVKAYQAHSQSILISRRAAEDLADAEEQKNTPGVNSTATYAIFSSAQHGFQNALDLWSENRKAKEQLTRCRGLFADTAYSNGDYDLALSLLDGDDEADAALVSNIRRSQSQRQARLAWFKTLQYATAASLIAALTFIGWSFKLGNDVRARTKQVAAAEVKLTQADAKIAKAEKEADDKIAEGDRQATERIAKADTDAKERISAAESDARETTKKAQADAELLIADANVKVQAATKLADELALEAEQQRYLAFIGDIRSTYLERGAYAAREQIQQFQEDNPELIASANKQSEPEWTKLLRDSDWESEADEIAGIDFSQPRLAATPDGRWLAVIGTGTNGSRLLVYDTNDLTKPTRSIDLPSPMERVAIAPNGQFVATVSDAASGGRVCVLNVKKGTQLQMPEGTSGGLVTAIAFDPQSEKLLTGGVDTTVAEHRIDADAGTITPSSLEGRLHQHPISAVGYSPDGLLAFSADDNGVIQVWQPSATQAMRWPYRHSQVATGSPRITAAALSDSSTKVKSLAYGCADGSVYLLQSEFSPPENAPGQPPVWANEKPEKLSGSHLGQVTDLSFAKDGAVLISSGADTIQLHDASRSNNDNSDAKNARKPTRRYHANTILSCAGTAGDYAFSSDRDGRVVRWTIDVPPAAVAFGPAPQSSGSAVTAIDYTSDGTPRVAVSDSGGFTHLWADNDQQSLLDQLYVGHEDHRRMEAWLIPSAPPQIVTVAEDQRACLWDAATGLLQRTIDLNPRSVFALSADKKELLAATDREDTDARAFSMVESSDSPLWANRPRVSAMLSFRTAGDDVPTIAIGLRDGQLFLWRSDRDYVPMVRSSSRPHWRPILAFAFNPVAQTLYAADSDGLISRWSLVGGRASSHTQFQLDPAGPISRLQVSFDGSLLLAIVNVAGSRELRLLDAQTLAEVEQQPSQLVDFVDAAFAPDGNSLLAVSGRSKLQQWTAGQVEWQRSAWSRNVTAALSSRETISGVRCDAEGNVLIFGPGFVQLWKGSHDDAKLISRIRSRPVTHLVSFRADAPDEIRSLSSDGRLDHWARTGGEQYQPAGRIPPALRGVVRACPSNQDGHAYLALRASRNEPTRLELWNLDRGEKVKDVGEPFQGACDALAAGPSRLAYAASERGEAWIGVIDLASGTIFRIKLPAGERAAALDLAPSDDRLVVCTSADKCYVASAAINGTWNLAALDRDDITAAAFSPHGDRLILGSATGQVLIVKPQDSELGLATRLLLTLPGHSDRITALEFANRDEKLALLSGDAGGRVLLHTLQ
ncbi:MAG: protein kinase [Pirellulales bacterium]